MVGIESLNDELLTLILEKVPNWHNCCGVCRTWLKIVCSLRRSCNLCPHSLDFLERCLSIVLLGWHYYPNIAHLNISGVAEEINGSAATDAILTALIPTKWNIQTVNIWDPVGACGGTAMGMLGRSSWSNLRSLFLRDGIASPSVFTELAKAQWNSLEDLEFALMDEDGRDYTALECGRALAAFLSKTPHLKRLSFHACLGSKVLAEILNVKLPLLQKLDASGSMYLDAVGAQALARKWHNIPSLRQLNLSYTKLSVQSAIVLAHAQLPLLEELDLYKSITDIADEDQSQHLSTLFRALRDALERRWPKLRTLDLGGGLYYLDIDQLVPLFSGNFRYLEQISCNSGIRGPGNISALALAGKQGRMPALRKLQFYIDGNDEHQIVECLSIPWPNLQELSFMGSMTLEPTLRQQFPDAVAFALGNAAKCGLLPKLDEIFFEQIDPRLLKIVFQSPWQNLKQLRMWQLFNDADVKELVDPGVLSNLPSLTHLELSAASPNLSDEGLKMLLNAPWPKLESVYLGDTEALQPSVERVTDGAWVKGQMFIEGPEEGWCSCFVRRELAGEKRFSELTGS